MKNLVVALDWDGIIFNRSRDLYKNIKKYIKLFPKCLKKSIREYRISGLNPKCLIKCLLSLEYVEINKDLIDNDILNFFYMLSKKNIKLYIISSSRKDEIDKFLDIYKKVFKKYQLNLNVEIFASDTYHINSSIEKYYLVKKLKYEGKKIIYIGDSYNDRLACEISDFCIVKKSLLYYISPKKPKGKAQMNSIKELTKTLYDCFK